MSGKKYSEIYEIDEAEAHVTPKSMYTYIINAKKYQETGEIELKRVLKKDLEDEASVSYVLFSREGCHGYPINEKDLALKSPSGHVGPFQMNKDACNNFLQYIKQNHPEMAKDIKGTGTSGYLNFVKNCQDKGKLTKIVEEYALSDYFKNRVGNPEILAKKLASHLKKTDENGNPDSTRLPLHVIAAMPTGVIARGNGVKFSQKIPSLTEKTLSKYCSEWISCTTASNGYKAYQKLQEIDYITPEIIEQYKTMNLAGADKLQEKYLAAVEEEEKKKKQYIKNRIHQDICLPDALKISLRPIPPDILQKRLTTKLEERRTKEELKKKKKETPNEQKLPQSASKEKEPPNEQKLPQSAQKDDQLTYIQLNHIGRERA